MKKSFIEKFKEFITVDAPEQKKDGEDNELNLNVRVKHLRYLNTGDYFGEVSLLTNLRRTASIFSGREDNLTCGKIETQDFRALLAENPELKSFLRT